VSLAGRHCRRRRRPLKSSMLARMVRHLPTTGTVDRILCCLVLEHVADLGSLFRELARVCGRRPRDYNTVDDYVTGALRAGLAIEYLGEKGGTTWRSGRI